MHAPRLRFLSSAISRPAHAKYLRASRRLHTPIPLPYPIEGGLGAFLPPSALKTLAVDYQKGLLDRLNEEVRGTPEENKSVAQTVISTARSRQKVLAFNYASLALNNSFFLDRLRPPPAAPKKNHQGLIDEKLHNAIVEEYGSIASFKSAFSAAVSGVFSSGYVWFVTDKNGSLGIYPTFGPGSLLVADRSYPASRDLSNANDILGPYYRDELDENSTLSEGDKQGSNASVHSSTMPPGVSPSSPTSGISGADTSKLNPLHSRSYHTTRPRQSKDDSALWASSAGETEPEKTLGAANDVLDELLPQDPEDTLFSSEPNLMSEEDASTQQEEDLMSSRALPTDFLHSGETLYPLFCVPVYEHAWMSAGYGIWGKEEWMKQFWSVLDWEKVSSDYVGSIFVQDEELFDVEDAENEEGPAQVEKSL